MRLECIHYCIYKDCTECSVVAIETEIATMKELRLKVYKNSKGYHQKYKKECRDIFYIGNSLWIG